MLCVNRKEIKQSYTRRCGQIVLQTTKVGCCTRDINRVTAILSLKKKADYTIYG